MGAKTQTPDGTAFDHYAGDHGGPTETAHNLAQRLAERDEVRRLTWMSYTESLKVETENVESTLDALDFDRLTVRVRKHKSYYTDLRIEW